jgi:hypothetical protein
VSKKSPTPTQFGALRSLAAIEHGASAYTLGASLATMYALERRRLVASQHNPGSMIWPQTSITWRITNAGRAAVEDAP